MGRVAIDPILTDLAMLRGCSKRELRKASQLGTTTSLDAGEFLMRQGEPGREVMLITDGTAIVQRDDANIATLRRGDIVGELSVLADRPRTASVISATPITVAVFTTSEFFSLLDASPRVARNVLRVAFDRFGQLAA
jgi:CRP-like cAMP-binding protein